MIEQKPCQGALTGLRGLGLTRVLAGRGLGVSPPAPMNN